MLTKLFILAVGIIGIATKPSSGATAFETIMATYDYTEEAKINLKSDFSMAGDCTGKAVINRTLTVDSTNPMDNRCEFCICTALVNDTSFGSCDNVPCLTDGIIPAAVQESWVANGDLFEWPGINDAVPFQVYKVDDGYCYAPTNTDTEKSIKCFAHRL